MSCDLENTIGGCIDDPISGPVVIRAVRIQDCRARACDVSQDASASQPTELADDAGGKSFGVGGKGPLEDESTDFPVARGAVLSRARGLTHAERRPRSASGSHALERCAPAQPQCFQLGKGQSPYGAGDIPESVATIISVAATIVGRSDA
jgi:hypothetical protein